MKIWTVEYHDFESFVEAFFTTKEKAENYLESIPKKRRYYYGICENTVDEFSTYKEKYES